MVVGSLGGPVRSMDNLMWAPPTLLPPRPGVLETTGRSVGASLMLRMMPLTFFGSLRKPKQQQSVTIVYLHHDQLKHHREHHPPSAIAKKHQ